MTVHQAQHLIAATLQGYMEMGHKSPAAGTERNHVVCQQIRLNTADAIAVDSLYRIQCPEQVDKTLPC